MPVTELTPEKIAKRFSKLWEDVKDSEGDKRSWESMNEFIAAHGDAIAEQLHRLADLLK